MVSKLGEGPPFPPPQVLERISKLIDLPEPAVGDEGGGRERHQADAELVARLAASGFTGPEYKRFEEKLARYGYELIIAWVRSQRIFARCAEKGIKGLPPPGSVASWSEDDAEDLAQDTVTRALVVFRRDALRGGRWRPDGGASLATYFVGTCLFAFAEVYRRRQRSLQRRLAAETALQRERPGEVPDVADTVVVRQAVAAHLSAIPDKRLRMVVGLTVAGYTHAEIAALLADGTTTTRSVEGMLYRYRHQQADPDEEVNRDDQ